MLYASRMTDDQRTLLMEEYKSLRKEVELYIGEIRLQERYGVLAAWVIWAWLIANGIDNGWLWWAPFLPVALVFVRGIAMTRHIENVGRHLKRTEFQFGIKGWETCTGRRWSMFELNILVLLVMLVITFAARHFRYNYHAKPASHAAFFRLRAPQPFGSPCSTPATVSYSASLTNGNTYCLPTATRFTPANRSPAQLSTAARCW